MARPKIFQEHLLPISIAITAVGLLLTVLAFTANGDGQGWNGFYEGWIAALNDLTAAQDDFNVAVRVIAPIILFTGLWYLGEQLLGRRKIETLLDTESKSDFLKALKNAEQSLRVLPSEYKERVKERRVEVKGH